MTDATLSGFGPKFPIGGSGRKSSGAGFGPEASGAGLGPDRHSTPDFFICDVFGAAPKDDLGSMEHPVFSLSTRPDRRILSYEHNGTTIEVVPSVKGRATIHDKDIVIFCISQLMAALNAGRAISRCLTLKAHDLLVATNRDTSGDAYARLKDAFERLAGTRITTNMATGGIETTQGFGLIDSWEIKRHTRGGRMISVSVTLSAWLFRAVQTKSVLTLNRDYFRLRKPLERRIYELARKHCGRQSEWRISVATLHKKSGSAAPVRVFRAALRRMIQDGHLPDYDMSEAAGDLMVFERQRLVTEAVHMPLLSPQALEAARDLVPGADVYALQADWHSYWARTGQAVLRSPDQAFLGWVRARAKSA